MFREPEDYDFTQGVEDADFIVYVLRLAMPQLTRRQLECIVLLEIGLTQEQAGEVLGIARVSVKTHWRLGLRKVKEITKSLNQNAESLHITV